MSGGPREHPEPAAPAAAPELWTPQTLLQWSETYFSGKGIATARIDAERLLSHALGCSRLKLYLHFDRPLTAAELAGYRDLVRRRAERIPVPYLTGEVGFWNLTLKIRPGCLIPRPETETLVEAVLDAAADLREGNESSAAGLTVAEWGTGSGAIPLAVLSESRNLRWIATEPSATAIEVAAENRALHAALLEERGHRLELIRAAGLAPFGEGFRPQLVVSNPPYIPTAIVDTLEPEVARYEPRLALDGGADGLESHRALAGAAAGLLPVGGRLLVEIGYDQAAAVRELLSAQPGLQFREIRNDLAGRPRVAIAERG